MRWGKCLRKMGRRRLMRASWDELPKQGWGCVVTGEKLWERPGMRAHGEPVRLRWQGGDWQSCSCEGLRESLSKKIFCGGHLLTNLHKRKEYETKKNGEQERTDLPMRFQVLPIRQQLLSSRPPFCYASIARRAHIRLLTVFLEHD